MAGQLFNRWLGFIAPAIGAGIFKEGHKFSPTGGNNNEG